MPRANPLNISIPESKYLCLSAENIKPAKPNAHNIIPINVNNIINPPFSETIEC